ncbi:MAG: hypothetical protein IKK94_02095 [Clostridia bacterium]|nr:hypothetical protein [Clostridia bacterium]
MAKADFKGALGVERIKKFGGICHGAAKTEGKEHTALDICNFRILSDGSLEKREGFSPIMTLPSEPRAFISAVFDGEEMLFFVCENRVYEASSSGAYSVIGEIETAAGKAELFVCHGFLYLLDEKDLYRYEDGEFSPVIGYVPLYAKELDGMGKGEIFEDVNYLSDRIRLHYKVKQFTKTLCLSIKCKEICSILCGGIDILSKSTLSEDGMSITIPSVAEEGCEILVCLKLADESIKRHELIEKGRSIICDGGDTGRIILYGGSDRGSILISKEVSNPSYLESVAVHTSASDVYFPVSDKRIFPCTGEGVNSIIRDGSRMLLLGDSKIASLSLRGKSIDLSIYDEHFGSVSERGAVIGGTDPYVISRYGIYRLSGRGVLTDSGAECISTEIEDMLSSDFFTRAVAFYNKDRGELFFGDPESDEQEIFVYSVLGEKWYRFDGIPFDFFFNFGGKVCMLYGKYVFAFSEDDLLDTSAEMASESEIEAYYESNPIDFSLPERQKHIGRAYIKADCDGGSFTMTLEGDGGGKSTLEISDRTEGIGKYPTRFNAKTGIGRFSDMYYIIRSKSMGRTRIVSLVLSALK